MHRHGNVFRKNGWLRIGLLSGLLASLAVTARAQRSSLSGREGKEADQGYFDKWLSQDSTFRIAPYMMVQLWSTYTMNQQADLDGDGQLDPVADRLNLQLRRARLGFRANPYPFLKFALVTFYDGIGHDGLISPVSVYNLSGTRFGIWDAFFTWRVTRRAQWLNLTAGYFRPQVSRESITSGWMVSSFEKSMSQFYIRRHLVGTGQGRAMGVNVGGLVGTERSVSLLYNLGAFNPQTTGFWNQAARANTVGLRPSWVYVARAALQLGQPEMNRYALAYTINYFNERRGLSLGVNTAHQGRTDLFAASTAYGVDFLLNYAGLNFDGEYLHMQRRNMADAAYASQTGHLRVGYNLILGGKYFFEPTAMMMRFDGATDPEGQLRAASVAFFSGTDRTYDVGINWYLDHNFLKVALHYTWRRGELGNNQLFRQEDIGLIQRGDWAGLGFSAIF